MLPYPIGDYLTYLEQRGASHKTLREYTRNLRKYAEWIAPVELLDATRADVRAWRSSLTVGNTTIVAYATPVRGLYRWAAIEELIPRDPSMGMPLPKAARRVPRPIATADLEMAIAMANDRIRPWLVLAAYAGFRAQEIAYLRREDVLSGCRPRMLMVTDLMAKGGHERTVPMSDYVWSVLQIGIPRRGWMHPRRDGLPGPITPHTLSNCANTYLHSIGIDDTLHSLRHWFATETLRVPGTKLRVVQDLMGHASPATTAGYAAVSDPDAVAAVAGITPAARAARAEEYSQRDPR